MTAALQPERAPDGMTVRHLDVDLSQGFDVYWNNHDAYRSQLFNALSLTFPVGEQFFIDAVRHDVSDVEAQGKTELTREIKLFVGQEANAAGGGYALRVAIFLLVSLEFIVNSSVQCALMLGHDRQLFKWSTWRSAARFWWGKEGLVWHIVPHWLAYLKPSFHPWQHDNRDLLARWQRDYANAYRTLSPSSSSRPSA